jgi:hypothetical protein
VPPSSDYLPLLKKAGLVLVVVGLLDLGLMIYAIASQVSYSSSLNFFAVVAGVFLLRGNLRAASAVRWLALFFFAALVSVSVVSPFLLPLGLLATYVQVNPLAFMGSLVVFAAALLLLGWQAKQLSAEPIKAARLAAGRKERDARIPLLLGVGLAVVLAGVNFTVQRSDSAARAVSEARAQLGADYEFHVSSINYRTSSEGKVVSGVVTAWKSGVIKDMRFQWRE